MALLLLPATLPFLALFELLAFPLVFCYLLCEAIIRFLFAPPLRRQEAAYMCCTLSCQRRSTPGATPRQCKTSSICMKALKQPLSMVLPHACWAWLPIWRALTKEGRNRCEYLQLRRDHSGIVSRCRCSAESVPRKPLNYARLVFLSDTHGQQEWLEVPDGDVLCVMGDICVGWHNRCFPCRSERALAQVDSWLGRLPHRHKLIIGGNHDAPVEARTQKMNAILKPTESVCRSAQPFRNATYLENSGITLDIVPGRRALRIWGTPWSPAGTSANRAFRPSESSHSEWMERIPSGQDLLLSHAVRAHSNMPTLM